MKSTVKIPPSYLKNPLHFLALGFGSGLLPKAPGTFGTLAALPLYVALSQLTLLWYGVVVIAVCVVGVTLCEYTSRALRVHDHPGIVVDEMAGYLITMMALPFNVEWMVAGFVVFRFFDIVKPWPISWLDKYIHGGLGIMLDDVLAGVMACVLLHGIKLYL